MTEAKMAEETKHVFEVYIRSTPEKIWHALSDPETMKKYFFGQYIESDGAPGSTYYFVTADGSRNPSGKVVEYDPPRRMVSTFQPPVDAGKVTNMQESRLTWEITPMGEACKLTLVHDRLDAANPMSSEFSKGWNLFLSAIKTYLETGEPLTLGRES
jgi:uncharacterized protein YndB with AHSA1/START domain